MKQAIWVLASAFALVGCGGGGSGSHDPSRTTTSRAFAGRVIYHAPIAQAQVSIKDAEGRNWQATTDGTGRYRIELDANATVTPPLLVRAQGVGQRWEIGNGATASSTAPTKAGTLSPALVPSAVDRSKAIAAPFSVYATSNEVGNVPVTPSTTLVVTQLTGNRAEAAFHNLGNPGTTIAAAFDRNLVQAAQTKVKQGLALLGLPATLVDDPAAESLVSVDLTSTYEKLVSGDVFSAAVAFFSALVDNQTKYGCNGEAWGTMSDDGQRRPSCLSGPNADVSHLLTSFMGVDTPRSTDVETRAEELAGVNGPGGGWKFQSERIARAQRVANLQPKVTAAFKFFDSFGNLSGTASNALAYLATRDDNYWSNLNKKLCESLNVSELSDLTYSYLALKRNMRQSAPAPKDDAAEGLDPIKFYMTGTRAVNRIVPATFTDGVRTDPCPILNQQKSAIRALVSAYVPGSSEMTPGVPPRPPLAALLSDMYALLDNFDAKVRQGASFAELAPLPSSFAGSAGILLFYYPSVIATDVVQAIEFDSPTYRMIVSMTTCLTYGASSSECKAITYTSAQFKADINVLAAAVPADYAAGSAGVPGGTTAESGATALANIGAGIAQFLIDEYEQRFDDYFDQSGAIYYAVEVQGYVVDRGLIANERDASIVVPDVSAVGYKVNGSSLELTGQFAMRSVDAHMVALDPNVAPSPRRLTSKVLIDPTIVPAVASCISADEACMGRLRRARRFTPVAAIPVSGAVTLNFAASLTWQSVIGQAARDHAEVLPYRWPLAIEEFFTLIDP